MNGRLIDKFTYFIHHRKSKVVAETRQILQLLIDNSTTAVVHRYLLVLCFPLDQCFPTVTALYEILTRVARAT